MTWSCKACNTVSGPNDAACTVWRRRPPGRGRGPNSACRGPPSFALGSRPAEFGRWRRCHPVAAGSWCWLPLQLSAATALAGVALELAQAGNDGHGDGQQVVTARPDGASQETDVPNGPTSGRTRLDFAEPDVHDH